MEDLTAREIILMELSRIYGRDLQDDIADEDDLIHDLHLDSISLLELFVAIEHELGVNLDTVDMFQCQKFGGLVSAIEEKVASR